MKTTITMGEFVSTIQEIRPDNFSREALEALFECLEEQEDATGFDTEFDPIGICCEFTESTWQAIASDYRIEIDQNENEDEQKAQVLDYLADQGVLVSELSNSIVYRAF